MDPSEGFCLDFEGACECQRERKAFLKEQHGLKAGLGQFSGSISDYTRTDAFGITSLNSSENNKTLSLISSPVKLSFKNPNLRRFEHS